MKECWPVIAGMPMHNFVLIVWIIFILVIPI